MIYLSQKEIDTFWQYVNKNAQDGCWLWTGARAGGLGNYGAFNISRKYGLGNRRKQGAHRLAFCLSRGYPIGYLNKKTIIRHKCDTPLCCNPEHLEIGTQADNVQDCKLRRRIARGTDLAQTVLTEDNIREIRRRLLIGEWQKNIAKDFGVTREAISHIHTGRNWAWVKEQP
jgi:hypothetical protein